MIPKQDRTRVRTPTDIEQKYNLGKVLENSELSRKNQVVEIAQLNKTLSQCINVITEHNEDIRKLQQNESTYVTEKKLQDASDNWNNALHGHEENLDPETGETSNTTLHVTAEEKRAWNAKSDFGGSYKDLTHKPTIPTRYAGSSTPGGGATKLEYEVVFSGYTSDAITDSGLTRETCIDYNYVGITADVDGYSYTKLFPIDAFYVYGDNAEGCMIDKSTMSYVRFNDRDKLIDLITNYGNEFVVREIVLFYDAFGTIYING